MTEQQFEAGSWVRVTISHACVQGPVQDGLLHVAVGDGELPIPMWDEDVTVEQVEPADWPPKLYDVWGNARGARWWAIQLHRSHPDRVEIALMDTDGNDCNPDDVIRQSGPLFLVHREQTGGES